MDGQMDEPKAICPYNFIKVGGIKMFFTTFRFMCIADAFCISAIIKEQFSFLCIAHAFCKSAIIKEKNGLYHI